MQDDISKFLPEGFKMEDTTSSTTESSTSLLADILLSIEKKEKSGSSSGSSGSSTGSRLGGFRPHGGSANRPFKSKSHEHEPSATTESSKSQSVNPISGVNINTHKILNLIPTSQNLKSKLVLVSLIAFGSS